MENRIRQIGVNIILSGFLILSAFIIVGPLLAELRFNSAEFKDTIRMDSFNSRYPAGFGESVLNETRHPGNKAPHLNDALRLYRRALELNPRCADYSLKLGQIELILFLEDKTKTTLLKNALGNFRHSIENDPNGFNISYSIGYAGISVWKFLNKEEKQFISSRLEYSLKVKPWYSKFIYPKLWTETKDIGLLQQIEPGGQQPDRYLSMLERMEAVKKSAGASRASSVILKSDWHGKASDEKTIYTDGNMYWAGTIDAPILIPNGNAMIRIQAKSSPADNIYPYMTVELDGKEIGAAAVDNPEWKQYDFKVNIGGGIKVLSINFVNDGTSKDGKEDRNLFIGQAEVI
ncbi:MAG: carbohydrate-binding domain-containing protein [Candidatus Omnitrophota bacterium]|nr:carbohydrate-binding domain-containing protein [Candidatus Omnitrophota bacterium]